MRVVCELAELRELRAAWQGTVVGFVPTMGALHEGHLSLVRSARAECDRVVVSIFVNPTQFAPGEDFHAYPRTEEADLALCAQAGADLVWLARQEEVYPTGSQTVVEVERLGALWEGASRPGHFRGVATVVCKLFHAVTPTRAYFGEKDRQQLEVIRVMVRDLLFDLTVVGVPTTRDARGLALSSRNAYLNSEDRQRASRIWRALAQTLFHFRAGQTCPAQLQEVFGLGLQDLPGAEVERFDILDPTFERAYLAQETVGEGSCLCVAVRFAGVRLLDNIALCRGVDDDAAHH